MPVPTRTESIQKEVEKFLRVVDDLPKLAPNDFLIKEIKKAAEALKTNPLDSYRSSTNNCARILRLLSELQFESENAKLFSDFCLFRTNAKKKIDAIEGMIRFQYLANQADKADPKKNRCLTGTRNHLLLKGDCGLFIAEALIKEQPLSKNDYKKINTLALAEPEAKAMALQWIQYIVQFLDREAITALAEKLIDSEYDERGAALFSSSSMAFYFFEFAHDRKYNALFLSCLVRLFKNIVIKNANCIKDDLELATLNTEHTLLKKYLSRLSESGEKDMIAIQLEDALNYLSLKPSDLLKFLDEHLKVFLHQKNESPDDFLAAIIVEDLRRQMQPLTNRVSFFGGVTFDTAPCTRQNTKISLADGVYKINQLVTSASTYGQELLTKIKSIAQSALERASRFRDPKVADFYERASIIDDNDAQKAMAAAEKQTQEKLDRIFTLINPNNPNDSQSKKPVAKSLKQLKEINKKFQSKELSPNRALDEIHCVLKAAEKRGHSTRYKLFHLRDASTEKTLKSCYEVIANRTTLVA